MICIQNGKVLPYIALFRGRLICDSFLNMCRCLPGTNVCGAMVSRSTHQLAHMCHENYKQILLAHLSVM